MVSQITEAYSEINKIFNDKLKSKLDNMEKSRIKQAKWVNILNILAVISLILSLILFVVLFLIPAEHSCSFKQPEFLDNTFGIFLVLGFQLLWFLFMTPVPYIFFAVILGLTAQIIKFKFVSKVKNEAYPYVYKAIGTQLKYISGKIKVIPGWLADTTLGPVSLGAIQEFVNTIMLAKKVQNINYEGLINGIDILPFHNVFSADDIITGKYNDRPVNIIEFELFENKHDRKDNTNHKIKKYQGILFNTKMDKPFKSKVVVKQRGVGSAKINGMEKVILESDEFNKIYEVYGADQVESRYLLTTALMDRLISIYKCGQCVSMYVENNNATIIKETKKDMFEPDINKPVNDVNSYYEVMLQTKSILDFITTLKLDVNIGL